MKILLITIFILGGIIESLIRKEEKSFPPNMLWASIAVITMLISII